MGGGGCKIKNPLESRSCLSAKANKFSEPCILHLSSVPHLRMRPRKWAGKVNSVKDAWITLDFASLNTSPPVAFANITVLKTLKREEEEEGDVDEAASRFISLVVRIASSRD